MSSQLLIYESAVPVSSTRHAEASVEVGADYGFTRKVNSVPLMAVEFPHAAAEYAIVFGGTADAFVPAVILGMRGDENLYLSKDGGWEAKYIPAFVRRYPFVFASAQDGKTFTLCIDEAFPGFNREGRGQRLFGADQKPSTYVASVLKFLEQYQVEFRRTQAFCTRLKELNLLEPMRAQASLQSGQKLSLTGFMAVSRDKLKALPAEKLAELAKTNELELIYLHLQSMRNFSAMGERLAGQPAEDVGAKSAPAVREKGKKDKAAERPAR
jgi:hypothetical protein